MTNAVYLPPEPDDARRSRIAELKSERAAHTRDLIEIDRELAQFGERPGFDAFRSAIAGMGVAVLLDETWRECTEPSAWEDLAETFSSAMKWALQKARSNGAGP